VVAATVAIIVWAMRERDWGVRLADLRLPRWWALAVIASVIAARFYDRSQLRELERIGAELGDYAGTRDREAAEREARLVALTIRLARLTWALLAVTVGTLAVAIVTLALT
jgi:hypothetical protein